MKKHANIPIFIPHYGCPNACVFCNQVRITGKPCFSEESVRSEIDAALKTLSQDITDIEIAFFGGSFTAIPRNEMLSLLSISDGYIKSGAVHSVRLSTRPDAITEEILEILKSHGVGTIELGIQSTAPHVLSVCKRGHTANDSQKACELIKKYGFQLIGQMMTGLPGSTAEDEMKTAENIAIWGADGARIYPTVVLPGTELSRMEAVNGYTALTVEEATERCARVLELLEDRGVNVIRIGLCANEILENEASDSSYHAAIGELTRSRVFRYKMEKALNNASLPQNSVVTFFVPAGKISQAIGQKRTNAEYLTKLFNLKSLKVAELKELNGFNVKLKINSDN